TLPSVRDLQTEGEAQLRLGTPDATRRRIVLDAVAPDRGDRRRLRGRGAARPDRRFAVAATGAASATRNGDAGRLGPVMAATPPACHDQGGAAAHPPIPRVCAACGWTGVGRSAAGAPERHPG